MPIVNPRQGGGLNETQYTTLAHIKYNPDTDKVESDRGIQTTLNSLFLGAQHKMSSGAENIFFTNLGSDISWFPMWGGIKNMTDPANRTPETGTIKPSGRVYNSFVVAELAGPAVPGIVASGSANTLTAATSGVIITIIFEEDIHPTDRLQYRFFTDDINGREIYKQQITGLTATAGDSYDWVFTHPVEVHPGSVVFGQMQIFHEDEDMAEDGRPVLLRTGTNGNAYAKLHFFIFEDKDLAFKDDVDGLIVDSTALRVDVDTNTTDIAALETEVSSLVMGAVYKGAYDAISNTPLLPTGSDLVGDFYRVEVSGFAYEVGDILIYNGTTYDHIPVQAVTQSTIEASSLRTYDVYVKAGFTHDTQDGSALYPYNNVQDAVDNATDGDTIFLDGVFPLGTVITLPSTKGLSFFGADGTTIGYSVFGGGNDKVFYQASSSCFKKYEFHNIKIHGSGDYGIYIRSALKVVIKECNFINNGWNGSGLSTTIEQTGSVLGYDSTAVDLQTFYAGVNASNGGAMRIRSTIVVDITDNDVSYNLRGMRIQDCGIGGVGFISRNNIHNNIESGIYLAAGTYTAADGCENFVVYNNGSFNNSNNGILVIGGINNVVAMNQVKGNWNAGVMAWHCSNTRFRDMDLSDNNRSQFNGIGNSGDAKASIQISGSTQRAGADFIVDILDTQVYNTGTGSNTSRIGLNISSDVADIGNIETALINIDDVGFKSQDYCVTAECDVDLIRLTIGDCRYIDTVIQNVDIANGDYYELPFSNHSTNLAVVDLSVTNTGNVVVREGAGGNVINPYSVNELQAVAFGAEIKVLLKGSNKIQFTVPVAGCSIEGAMVNSVLSLAIVQLNDLFTNTAGFATGGGNPVTAFALTGDNLTLTLQDLTSYTVDVTTLGVDENKFVSSGALNGSNLELTMSDSSVVTINAANMINGSTLPAISSNWYYAYGSNAETEYTHPIMYSGSRHEHPFYWGTSLKKGREFVWQHDTAGNIHIGKWDGITHQATGTDSADVGHWAWKYAIWYAGASDPALASSVGTTTDNDPDTNNSVGVDIDTRYADGYTVTDNTLFMLRFGEDMHIYLYDVTDGLDPILISKSLLAETEDEVFLHTTGMTVSVQTNLPQFVERSTTWTIVADFDDSENGEWQDGIEEGTIIRFNQGILAGQKYVWTLPASGNNRYYGIDYLGTSTGQALASNELLGRWRWHTSEVIQYATSNNWVLNTENSLYDDTTFGVAYWYDPSVTTTTVSYRYNTSNVLEMWDEDRQELIMTYDTPLDGTALHIFYGATAYASAENILPNLSIQDIVQGSQPATSFAPSVSNQVINVTEGAAFNEQVVLDADSDLVTMYGELDAPAWAILNQTTGFFNGTAPAFAGDSTDATLIYCKAANPIGGITNFTVTINVLEQTYTNTKSLKFTDGVDSYLGGNAALVTSLERAGNGSGSADAWTIAFWYKKGVANQGQTLFYFGHNDIANNGHIEIKNTSNDRIRLRYGSTNNYIQLQTSDDPLTGGWNHIMVTYDGGTTGADAGSVDDYYSRFEIFVNGVSETVTTAQGNHGYSGAMVGQNYRFGKLVSGNYPKNGKLNQFAIWNSDQSSNLAGLYNGGATQDISTLVAGVGLLNTNYLPPAHYYEITDSVTTIPDLAGTAHFVGYNFSNSDLIDDAP